MLNELKYYVNGGFLHTSEFPDEVIRQHPTYQNTFEHIRRVSDEENVLEVVECQVCDPKRYYVYKYPTDMIAHLARHSIAKIGNEGKEPEFFDLFR